MSHHGPRIVFLDTETTGLDAEGGDRIVEIGCIEMVNRRLSGRQLHHYLNPERPSSPEAQRVHGLRTTSWPASRSLPPSPTNCWSSWPTPSW
jgi:DNA polymerase III epsilon subunit-like protein